MYPNGTSRYIKDQTHNETEPPKWILALILILLCLMAMDFKTRIYYFAIAAFCTTLLMGINGFSVHQAVIPALLLTIASWIFSPTAQGDTLSIIRPLIYPLCVLTGYNITASDSIKKTEKKTVWIIIALVAGSYGHFLLNMMYNIGKDIGRNTFDYWTRAMLSATGQSTLAVLTIGSSVSILFFGEKKLYKFGCAFVLLSIFIYNLILGGRTIIVLSALLIVINLIAKWTRTKSVQARIHGLLAVIGVAIIVIVAIRLNLFGIKDYFFKSNLYHRFNADTSVEGLSEDGRLELKMQYIRLLTSYPFGGDELFLKIGNYAHDIILDTYSRTGIIGALAIIAMLVDTIIKCKRVLFCHLIERRVKSLLLNVIFAILFVFMMEPILQGMPWLFACYCVIYGSLTKLTEKSSILQLAEGKHIVQA